MQARTQQASCSQVLEVVEALTFSSHRQWAEIRTTGDVWLLCRLWSHSDQVDIVVFTSLNHKFLQKTNHDVFCSTQILPDVQLHQVMFLTYSLKSVPHLWLSLDRLSYSQITLYCVIVPVFFTYQLSFQKPMFFFHILVVMDRSSDFDQHKIRVGIVEYSCMQA